VTVPNVAVRYAVLRNLAWQPEAGRVLEVGTGPEGLAGFVSEPFVGCDLYFDASPPALMYAVRASACQLPFPDKTFDLVVCMDTLEHIPKQQRVKAVVEIVRVTRCRAIIGFPSGQGAHLSDCLLARFYSWRRLDLPNWLQEHSAEFPSMADIQQALKLTGGASVQWKWAEFLPMHMLIMILETVPRVLELMMRSLRKHRRLWLSLFSCMNLWPCYRLICVVDRVAQDELEVARNEPLV